MSTRITVGELQKELDKTTAYAGQGWQVLFAKILLAILDTLVDISQEIGKP